MDETPPDQPEPATRLLQAIKDQLPRLEQLQRQLDAQYEDGLYSFYHQSSKLYRLQSLTQAVADLCRALAAAAGGRVSPLFDDLIAAGTGQIFKMEHNRHWSVHTRPILEAFGHAHYLVALLVRYARQLDAPPSPAPRGWAALLELLGCH